MGTNGGRDWAIGEWELEGNGYENDTKNIIEYIFYFVKERRNGGGFRCEDATERIGLSRRAIREVSPIDARTEIA